MFSNLVRKAWLSLAISGALSSTPVYAESLVELWERPIKGDFASGKSALALESCIGRGVSDWGNPHTLHGERVTDLWVGIPFAIRIEDRGSDRRVTFTASAAYDDRVERALKGCI